MLMVPPATIAVKVYGFHPRPAIITANVYGFHPPPPPRDNHS